MIVKQALRRPDRQPVKSADEIKASFDEIYLQPDPREYYRVLYGLDYIIPNLAKGVFRSLVAALERERGRRITVLDIGCSYGINAALLRLPLDIERLAQRYRDLAAGGIDTRQILRLDQSYFASWPRADMRIIGLDASEPAISYARAAGLIDDGVAANLEAPEGDDVPDGLRRMLRDVDLVISTGCVGYIGARTFSRVLAACARTPWVASFVLRMYPYSAIATALQEAGLVTEKLEGATFVQRRFHSAEECAGVLEALERLGISIDGKESDGLLHAELFLSRPPAAVEAMPLDTLVTVTSGAGHAFGRRYRLDSDDIIRLAR